MARGQISYWLHWLFLIFPICVVAFKAPVTDTDYSRQVCSGMWGNKNTYINVSFESTSQGQVAMVIYEWNDMEYLGKVTSMTDESLPKTYICTSDALRGGFCDQSELGKFIVDLPAGKNISETSFWSARIALPASPSGNSTVSGNGFWDNPEGNPTPPPSNDTSAWKMGRSLRTSKRFDERQDSSSSALNPSPPGIYNYRGPIQYQVRKTGYYCVAIVPVTILPSTRQAPTDVPYHPSYKGMVFFRNTFDGQLPATDYPKVNFYFSMFLVYSALAGAWAIMCYKYRQELLPIQYYLSGLAGFVVIEMLANWAYYRYLNAHGRGTVSTVFLFVVAILDAGRNALSFFMLLVVSLGLSVVRESLGRTMIKSQLLAGAHFIFGVLYAVGIVELELETTTALVLLLFVIPLAFTLSGFLMWILYALHGTMAQLRVRKQRYKLAMFQRLHLVLLVTVVIIVIFFVVSSLSFSNRLAEDYAAKTWQKRWWLLDAWLVLLYLVAFSAIALVWRPSPNNRRLVMSDEVAQEEEDAEDYDLEALESRSRTRDEDDDATLVGRRGPESVAEDNVVFEIGDEDIGSDDEEEAVAKRKKGVGHRRSLSDEHAENDERQGLINGAAKEDKDD